ncbi:MAG: hypothetical protein LBC62_11265, partial [Treponema sp.]|nr:hypothetical protein [Treponema sp.]
FALKKGENKMAEEGKTTEGSGKKGTFVRNALLPLTLAGMLALGAGTVTTACKGPFDQPGGTEQPGGQEDDGYGPWSEWGEWTLGSPTLDGVWEVKDPATMEDSGIKVKHRVREDHREKTRTKMDDEGKLVTDREFNYRTVSSRENPGVGLIPSSSLPAEERLLPTEEVLAAGWTLNEQGVEIPLTITLPEWTSTMVGQQNVDVIGILEQSSSTKGISISETTTAMAGGTITGSLQGFSYQAQNLNAWFTNAKNAAALAGDTGLVGIFSALADAEAGIKNRVHAMNGSTGNKVTDYSASIDTEIGNILDTIFAGDTAGRAEFDKWFEAYTKGQRLGSRDWRTAGFTTGPTYSSNDAVPGYIEAVQYTGLDAGSMGGNNAFQPYGRGVAFYDAVTNDNRYEFFMEEIQSGLKSQIVTALGLTGDNNANKMAEALIIQLGQDNEEFRALIDDFKTRETDLSYALNSNYAQYLTAQAQTQSGIKLAGLKR